jgi:SAM-dependent methyltransferase
MVRKITAVAAALALWFVVVLLSGAIIRAAWPEYVRVAGAMTFTLTMKLVRLVIGAAATLAAGGAATAIAGTRAAAAITGTMLLLVFIPEHISLWNKFPLWYHLTFLASLIPLSMVGGHLAGRSSKTQLQEETKLPQKPGTRTDDPFSGRHPTSHERMTGLPWDASYQGGPPPWDIGEPQPAIMRLASQRRFAGPVLDAGCGTGENALHIASLGLPVLGFDVAETALATARKKAHDRGIEVEFVAADAFQLERLDRKFQTVLDCGLFHALDGDERPRYVASLASVTEPDGTLYVLCFSDEGPDTGPHPVSKGELTAAFSPSNGWKVVDVERDRVQTRFHDNGAPAWLATIGRI